VDFRALQYDDDLWNTVIEYAKNCSWKSAGTFLAKQMQENQFSDWEKVIVAVHSDSIAGYCTLTKRDCIPDVDYSPYIGFLFVGEDYRGQRLSEKLINYAMDYAQSIGFKEVFLVSAEKGLYEKYGFIKIDEKKDIWGTQAQIYRLSL
jgi:N-acetylglutamate synthase-like GNAT family acetyltransferase